MGKSIVVQIQKNNKIIGNCLYEYSGFLSGIALVKDIVDNYNRNLSNVLMLDDLFVLRLLEEENADGSLKAFKPILREKSYNELVKKYPTAFIMNPKTFTNPLGYIAIDRKERLENQQLSTCRVLINLDNYSISFGGILHYLTEKTYRNIFDITIKKLKLNEADFDLGHIPFNRIEEAFEFVKYNPKGWIKKDVLTNNYCVPDLSERK